MIFLIAALSTIYRLIAWFEDRRLQAAG